MDAQVTVEKPTYHELAESLFDEQVGIQKLVWIQPEEVCTEALDDILGTCDDEEIEKIFGISPNGASTSEIISEIVTCNFFGQFLAEVHTPVLRQGGGFMFSWGYTRMTVILAPSLEEIVEKALAWGKQEQETMEEGLKKEREKENV